MKNKKLLSLFLAVAMFASASTANAAILFQDDEFHDIPSEGIFIDNDLDGTGAITIQFGSGGSLYWDTDFTLDDTLDIQGDLTVTNDVDFSASNSVQVREEASITSGVTSCTQEGEVALALDTDDLYVCTDVGTDTWKLIGSADADTLDGLDSTQFLRSDGSDNFTSGTLTTDAGTTLDVNGDADFSGATSLIIPISAEPLPACTEGEIIYNDTQDSIYVCDGTNTFVEQGSDSDFEDVYGADGDNALTTSGGDFSIVTGVGEFDVTSTGAIDFNAGSFDMDLTGGFAVDASGASNLTTDSGNLTLETTTSGDVEVNAAGDVVLDDQNLTSTVLLSDSPSTTGIDIAFNTTGIIDAINKITSTTTGEGASLVGIEAATLTNIGGATDVQDALEKIDTELGSISGENEVLIFDPEYPDTVIEQANSGSNQGRGKLEALYDSTDGNYYQWRTRRNTTQSIDLRFSVALPEDISTVNAINYEYYTGSNNGAENAVTVALEDQNGVPCGSSGAVTTAGVWNNAGTFAPTCTLDSNDAGEVVQFVVTLMDAVNGSGTNARVGRLEIDYSN